VENFTGIKSVLIVQSIFACVYLCDLVWDMVFDVQ
jgi:hypothetical protein